MLYPLGFEIQLKDLRGHNVVPIILQKFDITPDVYAFKIKLCIGVAYSKFNHAYLHRLRVLGSFSQKKKELFTNFIFRRTLRNRLDVSTATDPTEPSRVFRFIFQPITEQNGTQSIKLSVNPLAWKPSQRHSFIWNR